MGRVEVGVEHYDPMPIVGYCDRSSAMPGQTIEFFVSVRGADAYRAEIVRLINGDVNPKGPGFKAEPVPSAVDGQHAGREQHTNPGSYGLVADAPALRGEKGLALRALICPTTPGVGAQGLLTRWSAVDQAGYALVLDEHGGLAFWLGDGAGEIERAGSGTPLTVGVWYFVGASLDGASGEVHLYQHPVIGTYNGRLALPSDAEQGVTTAFQTHVRPPARDLGPVVMAGWLRSLDHRGRPVVGGHYNGKLEAPAIADRPLDRAAMDTRSSESYAAAWDFAAGITAEGIRPVSEIHDVSGNGHHGELVNLPLRGVTGSRWTGRSYSFAHAPEEYAAVHFHDDDLDDARWDLDFALTIPESMPSGVYAARLTADVDGHAEEDYVPFVVRPALGRPTARVAFLLPTCTYLAYANDNMAADSADAVVLENTVGSAPVMGKEDLARQVHREYGSSLYDTHSDGSGVCYSSWRRPIVNVRPKYRHTLSYVWQFNADLHLVDWCREQGYEIDVITDQDLHEEGVDLLRQYRTVFTGTHPEYCTERMLDAIEEYVRADGRLMYLGGNGFYWVSALHPDGSGVMEVSKWGGTEAWTAAPGEGYLAFTGELGGLWRNRGRAPQKLVGVGFIAQGLDVSTYYRRLPDSFDPRAAWIFEGVGDDELIGDFGLEGGGAAGMEIDCYDPTLGSPGDAFVVAASEGHTSLMLEVRENFGITQPFAGATVNPRIRADMVYFKTAGGGGVFSTGSIAWAASLSHSGYDNNVSRITANVFERFASAGELP